MVDRYRCYGWDIRRGEMRREDDGDYVRYSDYARLQEQAERWCDKYLAALLRAEAAEAERGRLRAALQEYENPSNWGVNGRFDANSPRFDGTSFAHGVLAALQKEPQP